MKLKSKEINIFSMSALDLFASALGAFIIIAAAMMPYFPNTGDSPEKVADIKEELAKAENELDKTKASLEEEQKKNQALEDEIKKAKKELEGLSKAKLPPLDLVIALDTTTSMDSVVNGLKRDIQELAEVLDVLSDDVGIGLVEFKDQCHQPTRSLPLQKVSSRGMRDLRSFANSMKAGFPTGVTCNITPPEAMAEAMVAAAQMNWRSSTKKRAVVLISDNKPENEPLARRSVSEFANRTGANHTVSTVWVNTFPSMIDPNSVPVLKELARIGKGKYVVEGSSSSFTITILKALVD